MKVSQLKLNPNNPRQIKDEKFERLKRSIDAFPQMMELRPRMTRIAIIGWPGTGKTTLANEMGGGRSTDDLIHLGWSEASEAASYWFDEPGPWVIEGVAIPRALRKWRERNPDKAPPVDVVINLTTRYRDLAPGAIAMGKGIDKVLSEIWAWLKTTATIEIR